MADPNYSEPLGDATPNDPPAPTPPQSPSGSVTNRAAQFNNLFGVTSTQNYLSTMGPNVPQQGTPTLDQVPEIAGTPEIQWTNTVQGFNPFDGYGSEGNKFS